MGKIKDPQLFLLIKNFLLVYLPVQRKLSGNTVTTYRTVPMWRGPKAYRSWPSLSIW